MTEPRGVMGATRSVVGAVPEIIALAIVAVAGPALLRVMTLSAAGCGAQCDLGMLDFAQRGIPLVITIVAIGAAAAVVVLSVRGRSSVAVFFSAVGVMLAALALAAVLSFIATPPASRRRPRESGRRPVESRGFRARVNESCAARP